MGCHVFRCDLLGRLALALATLLAACGEDEPTRPQTTDTGISDVTGADGGIDGGFDAPGDDAADACGPDGCVASGCQPFCPAPATCDEAASPPRCVCPAGYTDPSGDGRSCQDIDECERGDHDCVGDATCVNSPGGFNCDCEVGAVWDGLECTPVVRRRLAAGGQHVCERRPEGTIWCWGANRLGQLGDGTLERRSAPTQAGSQNGWQTVAAGGLLTDGHTCAVAQDASLWCWGRTVPSGTTTEPVQLVPEGGWRVIDLGAYHACGVKEDGTLWCWGQNTYDQMGAPDVSSYSAVPVRVGEDDDWASVATGDAHGCGLRDDGTLWCWGINQAGEVGIGNTERQSEPVQVGGDSDWAILEAGAVNTCGIRNDGSLWCWGSNVVGQVGSGEPVAQVTEPVRIGSDGEWRRIEVGGGYTCGIRSDGSLWCWGNPLGFATTTNTIPRRVGTDNDWVEVIIASNGLNAGVVSCGLHQDGALDCWGLNDQGELGIGAFGDKGLPEPVGEATWSFVEARSFRTYAIADDGTLWGWGSVTNEEGLLEVRQEPAPLGSSDDWSLIAAAEGHQCALKTDGTLWCWGIDTHGALGLGEDTYAAMTPTQVGDAAWSDLAVGGTYGTARSCGIQDDGTLWCWGEGPIGDTTREDRAEPVQVGDQNDWTQVSVGEGICALREPGTLWCWGADSSALEPVQIGEEDDWMAVDAGISGNCGIREPGTLWCWEDDDPPAQLGSGDDWWVVEELLHVTCGLRGEGALWCWGTDLEGWATGGGGALPQPTRIGETSDWAALSVGGLHVCGLGQDGRLWCWGEGSFGRLGQGDAWRKEPARVR